MRKLIFAVAMLALSLVSVPVFAGKGGSPPILTINKQSRDDNSVFVGINWNTGTREGFTGVVGYRMARVDQSDNVRGGIIDLTFPLTGADFGLGELHLKYLGGSNNVQGEAGVGYSFQGDAFLLNALEVFEKRGKELGVGDKR